tara:strand:+ start:420 stop:692 length:273 start_codon:yes stop_codon:yes gene_type:complete
MNKVLSAIKEASISVACLLEDVAVNDSSDLNLTELKTDIENIQNQITIIENYLDPFVVEELDTIVDEDTDPPDWTNGAVDPDSKYAGYRE